MPGLTPVRLERPAKGRTTLVLRPPASRVLPRALFSTDIAFRHLTMEVPNDDTRRVFPFSGLRCACDYAVRHVPNSARAQDLGIDCHVPRTTLDGRLVFDPEGQTRALCEADRATALNYTHLLQTVRDQVAQALRVLPPPLLAGFIDYLDDPANDGRIERWRPEPTDLDLLANTNAALAWNAADRAAWDQGILAGSGIDPEVWGIQARACGPEGQGQVVVWLDPASLRDRWTPAMVQRTTYAWMQAREGLVAIERTPKIIDGAVGAPVTRRIDGHRTRVGRLF